MKVHSHNKCCQIHYQINNKINSILKMIDSLIPWEDNNRIKTRGRITRNPLLSFIGDLSKYLFGIATVKHMNIMRNRVNDMISVHHKLLNTFQKQSSDLRSYMATNNEHATHVFAAVKDNHNALELLTLEMQHKWRYLILTITTDLLVNYTLALDFVTNQMSNLYVSIQSLLKGFISPNLIPPSLLSSCFDNIKSHLMSSHPLFHLIHTDVKYYYGSNIFIFMRHSGSLYNTLKLPISSQKHLFNVYQVTTFPIPLNHSSSYTTQLLKFNPYVIISKDVRYIAELSQTMYEQCDGQRIKHCYTVH